MTAVTQISFPFRLLKSYLFDINRIWRFNQQSLQNYQDKTFRSMVKFAYENVSIYHQKYKKADIHPSDIKKTADIKKLPFINKDDLRVSQANEIIPKKEKETSFFRLSTSGSTGKPLFVYWDKFSAIKSLEAYIRILKAYGGSWAKSKIALVIDLEPGSIENTMFSSSLPTFLQKIIPMKQIRYIHLGEKPERILNQLNEFSPDFLGSDPNMLRKLAVLKQKEKGKDLSPQCIFSGGSMLDEYTKKYVEQTFSTKMLDIYGATEIGPLAFQYIETKKYHVHSDYVFMEFLDDNKEPVSTNNSGSLVVTKLFGSGTPFIRYTGIEDFIIPSDITTNCGITTQMISQIEGRKVDMIHLPDDTLLSPLTLTGIPAKIMEKYHTYKIKQFQLVQHRKDFIECFLVFDPILKSKGVSVDTIKQEMKQRLTEKLGKDITVHITEKDSLFENTRSDYVKVVVSKIGK